jgi:hypothetical protein
MEPEGSLPHLQVPLPAPILSHISPVHATHPTSWRSILILYFHLRSALYNRFPHRSFPPYMLHAPPISSRIDHPNNTEWVLQIISSTLCSFLHSPVTSFLLDPNILLSTLFPNILSLVLPQCQRTSFTPIQNNTQIYSSVYPKLHVFYSKLEAKDSAPNDSKHHLTSVYS